MADILDEVDDMMRQERAAKFWHENGRYIIGFVVMTILFTAAISGYRTWNNNVQQTQTAALLMAVEAQNFPDNIAAIAPDLRPNLRGIALLNGASAYIQNEKPKKAAELYEQLSNDSKVPNDLRALGTLMSVRLADDSMSTDDKLGALNTLISEKSNVWQPYAMLEKALILANEKQDAPAALATLNNILQMDNLPPSLEQNAENLHHLYTIDVTKAQK